MNTDNTICAISTPPGNGAIAIIRLSGRDSLEIAEKIFKPAAKYKKLTDMEANTIHFGSLVDREDIIDEVLLSIFRAPNSYTGEDLLEISCHGSEYIQQQVMALCINNGAVAASPGEFTQRAFMNGKMDLSQAEAVADLIASDSEASHRIAIKQMKGGFSDELKILREKLLNFISLIELELDFAEEEVEFADRSQLKELMSELMEAIAYLADSFEAGNVLKKGVPVAISGKTNVGKSTLLNAIMREERAIVSDIAGTTRDVIEDVVNIEGVNFRFIDTAGLRETDDSIEKIGIKKAFKKIDEAYIVLYIIDADSAPEEIDRLAGKIKKRLKGRRQRLIIILNKTDKLSPGDLEKRKELSSYSKLDEEDHMLFISAKSTEDINSLTAELSAIIMKEKAGSHDTMVTNIRHYQALLKAGEALERAATGLETGLSSDLMAMDIRECLHYLGEISGKITTGEILENIFSKFCIGK